MADGLCAAGVSSLDIIPLIENGILTQNNTSLQYDILYAFNNIQKEIRCEKILISLLLQCIFSQTNIIQEQQLDI